ncbi:hypothetical protein [Streptomyces parvulus]
MSATVRLLWGPWRHIRPMKDFGHVHVVKHEDGREGVLKLARPNRQGKVSATTRQRFQEEVRRMQQLTGRGVTGIVPVLDADPDDPPQWFVMPKAVKLTDVLRQHGQPADLREVVEAVHQVAGTLAVLAERDISTGEYKPDNLLHFQGRAVVADFGIAAWPDRPGVDGRHCQDRCAIASRPRCGSPSRVRLAIRRMYGHWRRCCSSWPRACAIRPEGTHYTQGQVLVVGAGRGSRDGSGAGAGESDRLRAA